MEKILLSLREVLLYPQKREHMRQGARPFCALSFKATTAGAYVVNGERIPYEQGALCLIPAGVPYRRESEREDIFVMHFDTDTALPPQILVHQAEDIARYQQRLEEALALWQRREAGDFYRVSAILYELFAEVITPVERAARDADYLAEAARYIEEHFGDPTLSIEGMTARAFVSPACFRRRFKARYGCAPKQYLNRARMAYAKHLLQAGYYSAAEIAERCGYTDVGYFCNAFRHHTGESVSAYRRQLEKEI